MASTLAEIRARLAAQDNKSQNKVVRQQDNAIYPHWNMEEGQTATVRFLPDGDANNPYFWVERQMIKLPFNGIKGGDSKRVIVEVPCIDMYDPTGKSTCPVLAQVRPWYGDPSLKELAGQYWKKYSYVFQGFVHDNPLPDDKTPDNPIRRFAISPQIYKVIKTSLMDPEIEVTPTDATRGLDFKISKQNGGQYADYSTSSWARRESALTEAEQAAIDTYGLHTLSDFLPKKPSEAELRIIVEMFEASVDGQQYDPDRWGAYYKPKGVQLESKGSASAESVTEFAPAPKAAPVVESVDESPFVEDAPAEKIVVPSTPPATSSDKAQDILAMIKARQNKVS